MHRTQHKDKDKHRIQDMHRIQIRIQDMHCIQYMHRIQAKDKDKDKDEDKDTGNFFSVTTRSSTRGKPSLTNITERVACGRTTRRIWIYTSRSRRSTTLF
jgi:hypothetical protein